MSTQPENPNPSSGSAPIGSQAPSLSEIRELLRSFKTKPWKTGVAILSGIGVILTPIYLLNNQVVGFIATQTTRIDNLKEADDEATKTLNRQNDKIDNFTNKVEEVRVNSAVQSSELKQLRGIAEGTHADVAKLTESISGLRGDIAEISRAVKQPIKVGDATDPMQLQSLMEANFKTFSRHLDTQLGTKTLSFEVSKENVDIKQPIDSDGNFSFEVKSTYDKQDLTAEFRYVKPGSRSHVVFDDKSPFDLIGFVGVVTYGPPLKVEVRTFNPTAFARSRDLLKALTREGEKPVRLTVSLQTKPVG